MSKIPGYSKCKESMAYYIGYIIGSLYNIFLWAIVGAVLTFIAYCIFH